MCILLGGLIRCNGSLHPLCLLYNGLHLWMCASVKYGNMYIDACK